MSRKRYPKPDDFVPDPDFPKDHKFYGRRRCTAWRPALGRQCMGLAMRGKTKCRICGGKSPSGLAHPNFKNGIYSKALKGGLLENYQDALKDPELLALREQIALMRARIIDMAMRTQAGESGAMWKQLAHTIDVMTVAGAGAEATLRAVRELVKSGIADYEAWDEIQVAMETQRRQIESEQKRLIAGHIMIKEEDMQVALAYIRDLIHRNVHDRKTLQALTDGLRKLENG